MAAPTLMPQPSSRKRPQTHPRSQHFPMSYPPCVLDFFASMLDRVMHSKYHKHHFTLVSWPCSLVLQKHLQHHSCLAEDRSQNSLIEVSQEAFDGIVQKHSCGSPAKPQTLAAASHLPGSFLLRFTLIQRGISCAYRFSGSSGSIVGLNKSQDP